VSGPPRTGRRRPPRTTPAVHETQAGSFGPPTARRVALALLVAVDTQGAYANLVLPRLLTEADLPERERGFATELSYGALRAQGTLDALLAPLASRPLAQLEPEVRAALRLGAYQLWALRVPPHAAVGETVGLVAPRARGFVNAILRAAAAKLAGPDPLGLADLPARDALAREHTHPRWIVDAFAAALGDDLAETAAALAADSLRPPVHLLAVPGRLDRDALVAESSGEPGRLSPFAVVLAGGNPEELGSVRHGAARVQDEGSQLCALALHRALPDPPTDLAPGAAGQTVVDLTAGPGGKAALLAGLGAPARRVVALELHQHRARLVRDSGVPAVVTADGRRPPLPPDCADAVLLDAPCSGLGALRRRPEARWRRQPGDIPGLVTLQRELLAAAATLVRPGGILAYVVCSPHLDEAVITAPTGFTVLDVPTLLGLGADARAPEDPRRMQLWPHRHGTDAMSMTLLAREG
jgi:16S rRNA (cytosine967-C5)-methyltransferase